MTSISADTLLALAMDVDKCVKNMQDSTAALSRKVAALEEAQTAYTLAGNAASIEDREWVFAKMELRRARLHLEDLWMSFQEDSTPTTLKAIAEATLIMNEKCADCEFASRHAGRSL